MMYRMLLITLFLIQSLYAEVEREISLLDFTELLSAHNNINIYIDDNISSNVSLFVPEDIKPQDYFDMFKLSIRKLGYDVLKKGDVYFIDKIPERQIYSYFLDLKYNSFDDVSKYLKFKNITFEYISSSNRFVIYTYPAVIASIIKDVERVDVQKRQVTLKFTIIEISDDDIEQIGVDFTSSTVSTDVKSVLQAFLKPLETNKLVFESGHFYTALKLYNEKNKLNINQNPFILVQDGKEFSFQAVKNIPYKTSETVTQSTINSEQTKIDYKDVGLKISGTPYINSHFVNLDLNLSIEDILSVTDNSPTTYKRHLKSNSNLQYGQVLILSGIKQTKIKDSDYSVPYISNIPYLGEIFKYNSRNNQVSNISIAIEILHDD
jgi:general secretion pathway protein D